MGKPLLPLAIAVLVLCSSGCGSDPAADAPGARLSLRASWTVICSTCTGEIFRRYCWDGMLVSGEVSGGTLTRFRGQCYDRALINFMSWKVSSQIVVGNLAAGRWRLEYRDDEGDMATCEITVPGSAHFDADLGSCQDRL